MYYYDGQPCWIVGGSNLLKEKYIIVDSPYLKNRHLATITYCYVISSCPLMIT